MAACVPLVVAGGAISAFNDNALSTNELAHMMNARFDKLSERIDQGFGSLADKLEGLVQDINEDQASKQFATVSTINEFYRHMWVHIHQDALTEESLPSEIRIVEFGAQLRPTALREYLQNVLRSGAMILDVLRAAVGFVAARSQLYAIELLRCALDGHGTCQPGVTDEYTKKLDEDFRGYEPIVQQWKCHYAVLAADQQCLIGEHYMQCLPQYLNVDLAASGVTVELKDLPANITVGGTCVVGKLKDLPASVKYVNVSGLDIGGLLKDLPASVTYVGVSGTSVEGGLRDLTASVTHVDVSLTEVGGLLKDLTASVTYVDVSYTSVRGEFRDLPASVTYVEVSCCYEFAGELKDLTACVTHVDAVNTDVRSELKPPRHCHLR